MRRVALAAVSGIMLAVLLLVGHGWPAFAQQPAGARVDAQTGSYIVGGSPTDAELDKLLDVIRKLPGVEQAEIRKQQGATVLRVRGTGLGTLISTAAQSA